jgi:hypothetical protein
MMSSTSYWNSKLSRTVPPVRAEPMQTLADARSYILALPPGVRTQEDWERAVELLLTAAESGTGFDIEQATFQLERALLFHKLLAGR